jgi:hypothetical protein
MIGNPSKEEDYKGMVSGTDICNAHAYLAQTLQASEEIQSNDPQRPWWQTMWQYLVLWWKTTK